MLARWRRPAAESTGTVEGGSERVLIVEDDRIVRETATDMLASFGYRTVATSRLEEARSELDRSKFDLLFTDFILPGGVTGDDVAAYARSAQPDIAVLYTSGYPRDKLKLDLLLTDDIRLIGKPYPKEALGAAVRQLLDAHQSKPKRSTA